MELSVKNHYIQDSEIAVISEISKSWQGNKALRFKMS